MRGTEESGLRRLAIKLLAAREHSRAELQRKLHARGFAAADIAPVLATLAKEGLQSDRRFAERYIADRSRRGYGPLRIRAELVERGVGQDAIMALLDVHDALWVERLESTAQLRFGDLHDRDRRDLARRARYLERRGFPADAIRHYLFD